MIHSLLSVRMIICFDGLIETLPLVSWDTQWNDYSLFQILSLLYLPARLSVGTTLKILDNCSSYHYQYCKETHWFIPEVGVTSQLPFLLTSLPSLPQLLGCFPNIAKGPSFTSLLPTPLEPLCSLYSQEQGFIFSLFLRIGSGVQF